jgi:hypothetical protein
MPNAATGDQLSFKRGLWERRDAVTCISFGNEKSRLPDTFQLGAIPAFFDF